MDVSLFVNHACNLSCSYCYNGSKFPKSMPYEIMRRGVEMAFSGKRAGLSFFGGEPLLEWNLIKNAIFLARDIEKKQRNLIPVFFSMTTNGTLADEGILDILSRERFHLVFSLDGCRESHDTTRRFATGHSSHELVVKNLKTALRAIPSVETITVIDPANMEWIPRSFEYLLSIGVRNLNFSINYEAHWTTERLSFLSSTLENLSRAYIDEYRKGRDFRLDLIDSKIITHLKGGYACQDRCRFGDGELCVAPSGRLYPCERLVGEDSRNDVVIGDIWEGVDMTRISSMISRENKPEPDCIDCKLRNRCMFWCGCINYSTTGDVGTTSSILCQIEQLVIAAADRAAATLFKEKNPIFIGKFYCV